MTEAMESLYVVQGSGGLLKVGRTCNFPRRLKMLRREFKAKGDKVLRHLVIEPLHEAQYPEWRLISALKQSYPQHSGREWFDGADFDDAVRLATAICGADRARQAYLRSEEWAAGKAQREADLAALISERDAQRQAEIDYRRQREARRLERRRRKTGPFEFMRLFLTGAHSAPAIPEPAKAVA